MCICDDLFRSPLLFCSLLLFPAHTLVDLAANATDADLPEASHLFFTAPYLQVVHAHPLLPVALFEQDLHMLLIAYYLFQREVP